MIRDLRLPNTKTPRCVSSLRRRWAYPHIFDIFSCSLLYSFISGHATMLSGGGPPGAAGLTRRRLSFSWAVALWQLVGTYLNKRGGWTISILVPSNKYLEGKRYLVGSFFLSDPNLLASLENHGCELRWLCGAWVPWISLSVSETGMRCVFWNTTGVTAFKDTVFHVLIQQNCSRYRYFWLPDYLSKIQCQYQKFGIETLILNQNNIDNPGCVIDEYILSSVGAVRVLRTNIFRRGLSFFPLYGTRHL